MKIHLLLLGIMCGAMIVSAHTTAGNDDAKPALATGNRKLLQSIAAPGGQCGSAVNTRCGGSQCCSQYGWCGVTSSHCGSSCQVGWGSCSSGSSTGSTGSTVPPPPATTTPPPPATGGSCTDTYAACPGWGVGSCGVPGVAQYCPCMCKTGGSTGGITPPSPPATTTPPPAPAGPISPPTGSALPNTADFVSFHIYDAANYPNGQRIVQYHTGYANVDNLACTDFLKTQSSAYWQQYGWTATTFLGSGLQCGDCVRVRNKRNGRETVVRVVDRGGRNGFDLDYERVFKPLDQPDNSDWNRGGMDIEWGKVVC